MLIHCMMYRDPTLRTDNLFSMYTSPALLGHTRLGKRSVVDEGNGPSTQESRVAPTGECQLVIRRERQPCPIPVSHLRRKVQRRLFHTRRMSLPALAFYLRQSSACWRLPKGLSFRPCCTNVFCLMMSRMDSSRRAASRSRRIR